MLKVELRLSTPLYSEAYALERLREIYDMLASNDMLHLIDRLMLICDE